jgi:multimeric flavodoxin WrbA
LKFLIVSGNPKDDGLCAALTDAVKRGAADGGADVTTAQLRNIEGCRVCGDGWGQCGSKHKCVIDGDDFDAVQAQIRESDAVCFITPVYWGETAEGMKKFLDRFRRCESAMGAPGGGQALAGKTVLICCSAGGTGNGVITAVEQLDRFCRHTGAVIFDYIGQNRWNAEYQRESAYAAAKAIVSGVEPWRAG